MKQGYKTTEFWLSAAAHVVSFLILSDVFAESDTVLKGLALASSGLASLGYSVSRGMAKKELKE